MGRQSAGAFVAIGIPGLELDAHTRAVLSECQPGSIVLFGRNIASAEQLSALTADLRRTVPDVLLAVDAEGGRVDRLAKVVGGAPAAGQLAGQPTESSRQAGLWVGRALRLFGFDVDFAPVVDLDRGQVRNALDGRYFGHAAPEVVERAGAFVHGLEASGIVGCVKHFPGLGAASADTHHGIARIALSRGQLAVDLGPFRALLETAGAVMIGHALYPEYEPDDWPASLSRRIATTLLRRTLRFGGLSIADDLEMGALGRWGDVAERAVLAFGAGCDLLPVCSQVDALPAICDRLARPEWAGRRRIARRRLAAYRERLANLRTGDRSPVRPFTEELTLVERGLAALTA
jgi:beta-N-acetylhexosaminidase